jgi:hypothetical protein
MVDKVQGEKLVYKGGVGVTIRHKSTRNLAPRCSHFISSHRLRHPAKRSPQKHQGLRILTTSLSANDPICGGGRV